jgi:hypothetical protein
MTRIVPETPAPAREASSGYSRVVGILERINRAAARLNRALGSAEGTTEGHGGSLNPALRHASAAERQEFPPEELASEEEEQTD